MIVQSPDGKNIDFGDMAPDQVQAAMQKLYSNTQQQESIPEDMAKSFGTGVGKGAIGLAAAPFDLGAAAGGYLAKKAVGNSDFGITPDSTIGKSLEAWFGPNGMANDLPNSLGDAGVKAAGLTYQPQTMPGKFSETVGEFLPAVAAFSPRSGSLLKNIGNITKDTLSSGIGSEAAGQLTKDTKYEPYARLIGGIAGYGAGNYASGGLANIAKGTVARSPEKLEQVASQMKASAGNTYDKMREIGAVFNQDASSTLPMVLDDALTKVRFIPELNPKTRAIVETIKSRAETGQLGLDDLDQYRRLLGRVGSTEDGVSAGTVKKALDEFVTNRGPQDLSNNGREAVSLLNQGRKAYTQASKFEDVADVLQTANGDPNRIKAGLTRLKNSTDNFKNFSSEERKALNEAATTGIGENILKAFGKFGLDFSKSGVGNTVLPALAGTAGYLGVPGGMPLAIGGTIARQGQKYLARGKAENALRLIQGR